LKEYHKINTVFKRDERTRKIIEGDYSLPEFEFLKDNPWVFTEKVDGTNVRVMWELPALRFNGKTDNAQMPMPLIEKLQSLFTPGIMQTVFPEGGVCLYGEGYGARIQKGGGNYNPNGVDFVLFDVRVGDWWLERHNVEDVAKKLGVAVVPIIGEGTLADACKRAQMGITSTWGGFPAEGLVMRPKAELRTRRGDRIIAKIKCKDFQ